MGSMKYMDSKGVLFSLLSLILVIVLVSLTNIIPEKTADLTDLKNELFFSEQNSFFHTTISRNILDIQNFSVPQLYDSAISFTHYGNLTGVDPGSSLSSYISFIEENFSSATNTQIRLDGSGNTFIVYPYLENVLIQSSSINSTINVTDFSGLRMTVISSSDDLALISNSTPADSGDSADPWINITVTDTENDLIETYAVRLDSVSSNSDFRWEFPSGNITLNYGSGGILYLQTDGENVSFSDLTFEFSSTHQSYAYVDTNISIDQVTRKLLMR